MNNTDTKVTQYLPVVFTPWQLKVIKSWSKNETILKAATELGITEHTLNTHLKRMRKKTGVNRTFQVYLLLQQNDLI